MEKIKQLFTKENIIKGLKWFFFSYIWLAVLFFIIDIVSKQLVMQNMTVGQKIVLIPGFLNIEYAQNPGMAFSTKTDSKILNAVIFISVSVIGASIMIFALIKYWKKLGQVGKASLMLMLSGTIGNLIDRSFYVDPEIGHFVVDFISFSFFPPIFNIADSCLTIGVVMLIIYLFVVDIKSSKAKKAQEEKLELANGKDTEQIEIAEEPQLKIENDEKKGSEDNGERKD